MLFYVLAAAMRLKGRVDGVPCSLQRWVQSGHKSGHSSAFQISHSSALAKGVQFCQVFSMASAPPFLGVFFLLGPTILTPWEQGHNQVRDLFSGLAFSLLSVCSKILVNNITSDLEFLVKGCNWCNCVKIRISVRELGSQDRLYTVAGYSG